MPSYPYIEKAFIVRGNLLCSSLCPLPLVLFLGTTEVSSVPSFLHPPFNYLYTLIGSPWAFSFRDWTVPAFSALPYRRDPPVLSSSLCPISGLSHVCPCLSCTGKPRTGPSAPAVDSPVVTRGERSFCCNHGLFEFAWKLTVVLVMEGLPRCPSWLLQCSASIVKQANCLTDTLTGWDNEKSFKATWYYQLLLLSFLFTEPHQVLI